MRETSQPHHQPLPQPPSQPPSLLPPLHIPCCIPSLVLRPIWLQVSGLTPLITFLELSFPPLIIVDCLRQIRSTQLYMQAYGRGHIEDKVCHVPSLRVCHVPSLKHWDSKSPHPLKKTEHRRNVSLVSSAEAFLDRGVENVHLILLDEESQRLTFPVHMLNSQRVQVARISARLMGYLPVNRLDPKNRFSRNLFHSSTGPLIHLCSLQDRVLKDRPRVR